MASKPLPSPEVLRQLLRYEPETGKLFWRGRPSRRSWNTKYAGKEAFAAIDLCGYRQGKVAGITMNAHRVIWAIVNGEWPTNEIDHINGVKDDNRLSNLRAATRHENMRNRGMRRDNKSGYKGVCWHAQKKKWNAQITVDSENHNLGYFDSREQANTVYTQASLRMHGDFVRGK